MWCFVGPEENEATLISQGRYIMKTEIQAQETMSRASFWPSLSFTISTIKLSVRFSIHQRTGLWKRSGRVFVGVEPEFILTSPSGELSLGQTDTAGEGQVALSWRESSLWHQGSKSMGIIHLLGQCLNCRVLSVFPTFKYPILY